MKFIAELEIDGPPEGLAPPFADAYFRVGIPDRSTRHSPEFAASVPIYARLPYLNPDLELISGSLDGIAIDLPLGQPDLDQAGAILRVAEARAGLQDGVTRLIGFPFPDLVSLADTPHALVGSSRLYALAHDEPRLQSALKAEHGSDTAPLIFARARVVADARKLGCLAYLKPAWSEMDSDQHEIIKRATADGFDGLIGPPALAALFRNM